MSTETAAEMDMGTKPVGEHKWLSRLVGDWNVESEMWTEPGAEPMLTKSTESVKMLGELWAISEGRASMPNGDPMHSIFALGYDVSFKKYRGCWIGSPSSHLWVYDCELSEDGNTMTMNCTGPSMVNDGETAQYRDVIEFLDDNTRTWTNMAQDEKGEWKSFMKSTYKRA